ncbi:MAG TPA: hypothetical protein DCS93_43465 [Microscillaceae bacterium]|nr:hypothetical protein [Microscillaceae bacterium]
MNRILMYTFFTGILIFNQSCSRKSELTETDKRTIINSAKATVQKVFDASNNLKFLEGLNYYSGDADAYYTNNGTILTLDDLKKSYSEIGSSVEVLKNVIKSWKASVLSENTVAFTLPIHLKIKLAGIPEYNGQLVWSGIVQKRSNQWRIVQSHESWLNCVEVMAALTPTNKKEN